MAVKKKIVKSAKTKKRTVPPKKKPLKKKTIKKAVKKSAQSKPKSAGAPLKMEPGIKFQVIGKITHFFPHVSAGVIKLSGTLKKGDMINIKGHTTDFKQTIDSMQLDHKPVIEAKKGQEIGLKVKDRVRIGDTVYKL